MKHCTTIEQSKKLLELGLNPESADMLYDGVQDLYKGKTYNIPIDGSSITVRTGHTITERGIKNNLLLPCWSLGALLELMPPYLFEWERGIDLNIYRNLNGKGWHISYMPNNINDMKKDKFRQITNGDTPIEAAYSMVVYLLDNGYIKKEPKTSSE